jgi:hypothetical protein
MRRKKQIQSQTTIIIITRLAELPSHFLWKIKKTGFARSVVTMGRYPDLQPALPGSFVKPSRTSRIMQPRIVLATVVILGFTSLIALVVAGLVLLSVSPRTGGVNATQAFALVAVSYEYLPYSELHD